LNALTDINTFISLSGEFIPVIDVRSPAEYAQGHFSGAYSFPIFSNEERARVGTLYKTEGKEAAIELGLELVGPKLKWFIQEAKKIAPEKKVLMYCWRGGMRSGSMAWLLEMAGFEVYRLKNGYKSFRKKVLSELHIPERLLVLGGKTGVGKTTILQKLKEANCGVLNLEDIAQHKGSAFGNIGYSGQPTQEQFENDLFFFLEKLKPFQHVWIEDESRMIGTKVIPETLWNKIRDSMVYFIDVPIELRIKKLVNEYGHCPLADLLAAFEKIKRRLGTEQYQSAVKALNENNLQAACKLALEYYDKSYLHGLSGRDNQSIVNLYYHTIDSLEIANDLLKKEMHV